jgi:hypothetical protein
VRARCPERLVKALNEFLLQSGGFSRLIAAFYFQATERDTVSGQAFEFTHKSFGEYLTARRLVREIRDINAALALNRDFIRSATLLKAGLIYALSNRSIVNYFGFYVTN